MAWATASGSVAGAACKHSCNSSSGTRGTLCPLAANALSWCNVLADRWVSFFFASVRGRLEHDSLFRTLLSGPLPGLVLLDMSRQSRSIEVSHFSQVYDGQLLAVPQVCRMAFGLPWVLVVFLFVGDFGRMLLKFRCCLFFLLRVKVCCRIKVLYFGHCVAQFKRVVVGWC